MSKNIDQVYNANPSTTLGDDDLLYAGKSPYGATDDTAIKSGDYITQINQDNVQTTGLVTAGDLPVYGASPTQIKDSGVNVDTSQHMTGLTSATLSAAPTIGTHATNKTYVDAQVATRLALAGGTMTGNLILSHDPTLPLEAATKHYVDTIDNDFLEKKENLSDVANATTSFNNISPLTTKGDLISHNGTNNVRVPVAVTDGQVVTSDSTQSTGWKWAPSMVSSGILLNIIYVSTQGNDTTGDGTQFNPVATRNKALTIIGLSATSTSPYIIFHDAGSYSYSSWLLKPWIFDMGAGINETLVTMTGSQTLAFDSPAFAGLTASTGLSSLSLIAGSKLLISALFTTSGNNSCYIDNIYVDDTSAFTAGVNSVFNLHLTNNVFFGATSMQGVSTVESNGNRYYDLTVMSDNAMSITSFQNEKGFGNLSVTNAISAHTLVFTATNSVRPLGISLNQFFISPTVTLNLDDSVYVTPVDIGSIPSIVNRTTPAEAIEVALTPSNFTFDPAGDSSVEASIKGIDNALGAIGNNSVDFNANQIGSPQSIPNTTTTKIILNQVVLGTDTDGYFDIVTYRYTPMVSGFYELTAQISFAAPLADGLANVYIYKNGITLIGQGIQPVYNGVAGTTIPVTTGTIMNGSTDYVEVYVSQNTGFSLDISNGSASTYFFGFLANQQGVLAVLPASGVNNQVALSVASGPSVWSTATYPPTTVANELIYSSATDTITGLPTANNAVIGTNGSGTPSAQTNFFMGATNTALGSLAGSSVVFSETVTRNTIFGHQAGASISGSGQRNGTLLGYQAGQNIDTTLNVTAIGDSAAQNSHGLNITAIGVSALSGSAGAGTTGTENVAIGSSALTSYSTGSRNIGIGDQAAQLLTTGDDNTIVGYNSTNTLQTGSQNILIGSGTNVTSSSAANRVGLGYNVSVDADNKMVLGNTSITAIQMANTVYPASTTINQILYSSSANNLAGLPTATNSVLVTGAGGAPSLSTTLPSGLTIPGYQTTLTLPLSLSNGGTNASLTASNGGIFYSTATAGAILAGTATAGQMLRSGSTAAPSWSTATYPATTSANSVLASSTANVVTSLTNFAITTDNVLIGNSAGSAAVFADTTLNNVLIGKNVGSALTTSANQNVFLGRNSGQFVTNSTNSVGVGDYSCSSMSGNNNVGIGSSACLGGDVAAGVTGADNIGIGTNALSSFTTTLQNVGIGSGALQGLSTGSGVNVAVGYNSGFVSPTLDTGTQNTLVGALTGPGSSNAINRTAIGYNARATKNNQIILGNSSVTEIINASTTGGCYLGSDTNPFGFIYLGSASSYVPINTHSQTNNGTQLNIPDLGSSTAKDIRVNATLEVTGTSQSITKWFTYYANNASLVTLTLPSTGVQGDKFKIIGMGTGLFKIAQNASQLIHFDGQTTATGVGGSITAGAQYNVIEIECMTTNTTWVVTSYVGNSWTVVT